MKLPNIVLMLAVIAAGTGTAAAHGVWVAERWGQLGIVYGHGADDDFYDPAKITSVTALDEAGGEIGLGLDPHETPALLSFEAEPAIVLVEFDDGIYTRGPDGAWGRADAA